MYEQPRKKFNWPLVLIIAVAVIAYVNYSDSTPRESDVQISKSSSLSRGDIVDDNETIEEEAKPTGPVNKCGYYNFAYPDYSGTTKEGWTCADALSQDQDNECVLNPPAEYDGTINIATMASDPEITCCAKDGLCQW